MKVSAISLLALLSGANAVGFGSLRGEKGEAPLDGLACTIQGSISQDTCDATKSEDGSTCVWCSVASYGVCVSGDIAAQMEQTIPGLTCDDGGDDDDSTDDKAPPADKDDDVAPNDDGVPDDYWNCLEKYDASDGCKTAGCAWCDNKAGYGICMDEETAKTFDDSDWYSCAMPGVDSKASPVNDANDLSCLVATASGDASVCRETKDAEGEPCEWCTVQGVEFCANSDQSPIAEVFGGSCNKKDEEVDEAVSDPFDPTCVAATIGGDESCKATLDPEGKHCDWCSYQGFDFCANFEQAEAAKMYGGSCGDNVSTEVSDPNDPTCLIATMTGGDEASCTATKDMDGNSCEFCSLAGVDVCVNAEQAGIAEQFGASCKEDKATEPANDEVEDPNDPTCLLATITGGDESSCKSTKDMDGNSCDWCSFQGFDFCVNGDQAELVEQLGASCSEEYSTELAEDKVADPNDPSCLLATITGGDESSCKATKDIDGNACDWCSFQGFDFCANTDQAELVEQLGASCTTDLANKEIADPNDPSCLISTISGGDESSCKATNDVDGKPCDWCSFQGFDFCANGDQAELVEQIGASCSAGNASAKNAIHGVADPSDPLCIAASIGGGDESSCTATNDANGKPCDWCSFQGFDFCVNVDQAQIVEQYGASCNDRGIEISTKIA